MSLFVAPGKAKPVEKSTDPIPPLKLLPLGTDEMKLRVDAFPFPLPPAFLASSGLLVSMPLPGLLPKETMPPVNPNVSLFGFSFAGFGFTGGGLNGLTGAGLPGFGGLGGV